MDDLLTNPLAIYQSDPQGYAREFLGMEITDAQAEILLSLVGHRYTAAKASHAIGKTHIAAVAACWWFDCWNRSIVYITAPTWPQALGLTFKKIVQIRRQKGLPGRILETGFVYDEDKSREAAHFIRALNAEKGEGFQGEHSAPILVICEEAVGVPHYIFEAAKGLMTHPKCRQLEIANPTNEGTDFGTHCQSSGYNVLTISVFDHPNIARELECRPPLVPDAVRLQWLYEMLRDECEHVPKGEGDAFQWFALHHIEDALQREVPIPNEPELWWYEPTAVFQGRAMGEFPTQADRQVIPRAWLAALPPVLAEHFELPEIGCDVASVGMDRTGICGRRGPEVLELVEVRRLDTVEVAEACMDMAHRLALPDEENGWPGCNPKKIPIRVDVTGGLGRGPYDTMKHRGYNSVAVNSSSTAVDKEMFKNVRSELWWWCRDRVREKRMNFSKLPKQIRDRLFRELSTPQYEIKTGKKVVTEKDKIREALGASPDLADSLNLSLYRGADTFADTMQALRDRLTAIQSEAGKAEAQRAASQPESEAKPTEWAQRMLDGRPPEALVEVAIQGAENLPKQKITKLTLK